MKQLAAMKECNLFKKRKYGVQVPLFPALKLLQGVCDKSSLAPIRFTPGSHRV